MFYIWVNSSSVGVKSQPVISDLKVAMLYFEQLLIAKVIYDVINHKIILDDVCLTLMYVIYDVRYPFFWLTLYII